MESVYRFLIYTYTDIISLARSVLAVVSHGSTDRDADR